MCLRGSVRYSGNCAAAERFTGRLIPRLYAVRGRCSGAHLRSLLSLRTARRVSHNSWSSITCVQRRAEHLYTLIAVWATNALV